MKKVICIIIAVIMITINTGCAHSISGMMADSFAEQQAAMNENYRKMNDPTYINNLPIGRRNIARQRRNVDFGILNKKGSSPREKILASALIGGLSLSLIILAYGLVPAAAVNGWDRYLQYTGEAFLLGGAVGGGLGASFIVLEWATETIDNPTDYSD